MSDSEELTILEDIQALENALSQANKSSQNVLPLEEPSTSKSINDDIHLKVYYSPPHDEESSEELECPDPDTKEKLRKLIKINEELINTLTEAKNKLLGLIQQCKNRQELVTKKLGTKMKFTSTKYYNWSIGMPYFKTKDCYYAPLNNDAKLKASRCELEIHHLPVTCRWTTRDKAILLEAIRDELISKYKLSITEVSGKKILLPEMKKYIGALGEKEFDWMKIGTAGFQNRHTAEECRVMWNVFLHPDINKTKWSKKEDAMLNVLVKANNCQNWDKIAENMGTKRSGYQCFIRYNTNSAKQTTKSATWTKEEDVKLKKIVELLKLGNFVPWGEVATFIPERTKQQIYYRWTYNVAPYLKKGRFTTEEDAIFRQALAKYGPNFSRISTFVMPQRTSAQLNDHFNTLHTRETAEKLGRPGRLWEYKEDVKLLNLYKEYGPNWSRISKEFESKSRIQLRHRYSAIRRYEKRGIMLKDIPRMMQGDDDDDDDDIDLSVSLNSNIDDVDQELIDHFRMIRSAGAAVAAGCRPQRFFSTKELMDKVRKLYNILQLLHVKVNHQNKVKPQDHISEKDRQLFHVLGEFCRRSAKSVERERIVESYRGVMFGHSPPVKESYVPPLPYDCVPKMTRAIKRQRLGLNTIDYEITHSKEETQSELEYHFPPTPAHVLQELIYDYEDETFEKMKNIMTFEDKIQVSKKMPSNHKKIYILSPEMLNQYIVKSRESKGLVVINKNRNWQPMEIEEHIAELNYSWDWLTGTRGIEEDANFLYPIKSSTQNQRRRDYVNESIHFIMPNYSTLVCCKTILNYVKACDKNKQKIRRFKVSKEGRFALDLLRRRFEILFTYPICMARISMPPGMETINYDIPFYDEGDLKNIKQEKQNQEEEEEEQEDEGENQGDEVIDSENVIHKEEFFFK